MYVADQNILPGTGTFKCKRNPNSNIRKFKVRYCVRGYSPKEFSTEHLNLYSTLVKWAIARLILMLQCILDLQSQSIIYFTNDFTHVDITKWDQVCIAVTIYVNNNWKKCDLLKQKKHLHSQYKGTHLLQRVKVRTKVFCGCIVYIMICYDYFL